jgi:hypothetical protein
MDQTTNSNTMWYIIGAVVIIALAFWYFSASPAQAPTASTPAASNTTAAAISAELNQTSDGSAALNQDAAVSAQTVAGF